MLSSLALLAGVVFVQQLEKLPDITSLALTAVGIVIFAYKKYLIAMFCLIGFFWSSVYGHWCLTEQLPMAYENKDVYVKGYISSMPEQQLASVSFDFIIEQTLLPIGHFPKKIHLNWYSPPQGLKVGQSWQFSVKLSRPHGHINPGGTDYEAWLFANHIMATGSVGDKPIARLISDTPRASELFDRCRQIIVERLNTALADSPQLGLIKALTIGVQDSISQEQWQVFRSTGTTHLIVISGSHISLIAGLVYLCSRRIWAWLGILSVSPQRFAALMAWLAGLCYSGLAGYSLPTLRAMIMLTVALAVINWQRHTSAIQILMLALSAVLLFDPLSVISIGFWLSFISVGLLIYVSAGRLGRRTFWQEASVSQAVTFIGLSPLLIGFFQQISLIAPIANWLAVPLIGLIIVPVALLAVLLLFMIPPAGLWLLHLTAFLLQGLWWLLTKLATLPLASLNFTQPPWYAFIFAGVGVLLLLAPRGFPARYLSLVLFLPLLSVKKPTPEPGEIYLSLLDVGQGLATVVQTNQHTLIFDTGIKQNPENDSALSVILPYLRYQGINKIDTLIVSHGDNDHSGGADSLLKNIAVDEVISSVTPWAVGDKNHYCLAGQYWQWDGVDFNILSPPANQYFDKENDNACVLKISTGHTHFLLTADIESDAENWLGQIYGKQLHSEVLIAPHHGSKTSSSLAFLMLVQAKWILIPTGYLNKFHFPHQQVLERYQQLAIPWLNTADRGAITVRSHEADLEFQIERVQHKHYWQGIEEN